MFFSFFWLLLLGGGIALFAGFLVFIFALLAQAKDDMPGTIHSSSEACSNMNLFAEITPATPHSPLDGGEEGRILPYRELHEELAKQCA